MGLSPETRFVFRHYSAPGVFVESIYYAGMQLSDRKRKGCKEFWKGCKRVLHPEGTCVEVVSSSVCFPFISPIVLTRERRDSPEYDIFLVDIYPCPRGGVG